MNWIMFIAFAINAGTSNRMVVTQEFAKEETCKQAIMEVQKIAPQANIICVKR